MPAPHAHSPEGASPEEGAVAASVSPLDVSRNPSCREPPICSQPSHRRSVRGEVPVSHVRGSQLRGDHQDHHARAKNMKGQDSKEPPGQSNKPHRNGAAGRRKRSNHVDLLIPRLEPKWLRTFVWFFTAKRAQTPAAPRRGGGLGPLSCKKQRKSRPRDPSQPARKLYYSPF